ncbi:MAG TPA: GNAT family N-acetyltransferase [Planctomycetota bacterium]
MDLRLLPVTADLLRDFDASVVEFWTAHRARLGDVHDRAREVVKQTLDFHVRVPCEPGYGGFLAVEPVLSAVVGIGGFKGPPDAGGAIEIAYGTFPPFEGKGYATATAAALIALARRHPRVRRILAHTLPEPNASTHVLKKNGLAFAGEVMDPEDGRVWRWELPV